MAPGGMRTEPAPANVSPRSLATSITSPPRERAMWADVTASGLPPNVFAKRTRSVRPPTEMWTTWRSVLPAPDPRLVVPAVERRVFGAGEVGLELLQRRQSFADESPHGGRVRRLERIRQLQGGPSLSRIDPLAESDVDGEEPLLPRGHRGLGLRCHGQSAIESAASRLAHRP